MERVLTGWLALEIGGDALAVGTVFALRMLPFWLFGLVAGTVADRFPRRLVLMIVALSSALLAAVLGWITGGGRVELWQVVAVSIVGGSAFVFDMPSRSALMVDIVGRERGARAIALNAVALRLFGAVGAFAGGMVIPTFGVSNGYFLVGAVHLIGLALVAATRVSAPDRPEASARLPFGRAVGAAARLMVEYPAVRMVVICSVAAEMFGYSHQAAMPSVAKEVLLGGPEVLGALTAASSIGSTLAVIALTALPASARRQPMVAVVLVLWGLALIALGTSSSYAASLAIMLVVGACASAIDALQQTLAQLAVPEHQRGSAVGVWVFSIGMNLFGLFQVGWLAAMIGVQPTLLLNGALGIGAAVLIAAFAPSFRPVSRTSARTAG